MEFQLQIGSRDGLEEELFVTRDVIYSRDCGRSENLGEHLSIQGILMDQPLILYLAKSVHFQY